MTQADVAEAISVTRQTVSSYEAGRTQPDLETLKRLAEVYQADLHDVLYGGNRLQRKINRIKIVAITLVSIVLLGILIHSTLFLIMNKFFPVTSETAATIEIRFALRDFAETVTGICTFVFTIGSIILLCPSVIVAQHIKLREFVILFFSAVIAMFIFAAPFEIADTVFGLGDYLFPLLNPLIALFLFFTNGIIG